VVLSFAAIVLLGLVGAVLEFVILRGRTPAISTPGSTASLEKLRIGGVDQWILIRGQDRMKPVLLFLHGGPGMPVMFLAHKFQLELERDFVVVHWDRRGAGKSFDARLQTPAFSVRQTLSVTYELTEILRGRFPQQCIYLAGHSWGSYLGLLARHDFNCPSQLAAQYLDRLDAPLKRVVWFEESAHFPFFEESGRFHREMLRTAEVVAEFWGRRSNHEVTARVAAAAEGGAANGSQPIRSETNSTSSAAGPRR
jgi:predicted alpha/beta-fold hydrolase